jgi:hemoglobin-like flavoprotein
MDQAQQSLVRASFAQVSGAPGVAAAMFYGRLFEIDPELRPLFRGDLEAQGLLLMTMLGTAVDNLHQLDQILPAVRELGQRHAAYGVTEADYDTVATALLWTLEQALAADFTPGCAMPGRHAIRR